MPTDKTQAGATPEEKKDEEVKYEDVHNQSFDDIQREASNAEVKDDGTSIEAKKEATKPDDTATVTPTEGDKSLDNKIDNKSAEEKPAAPQIDPEKMKAEISQSVAAEVIKAMAGDDTGKTKEEKDELAELIKTAPWVLENRNPTYNEVILWTAKNSAPMIKKQIMDEMNAEAEQEEKAEQEAKAAQEKQTADYNKTMFTRWDAQLVKLQEAGRIPKIVNQNDQNDPGVKARVELFKIMQQKVADAAAGKGQATDNLIEIYHEEYAPKLNADGKKVDPALERGKNAPVAGARKSVSANNDNEILYNEIHDVPLEDLVRQAANAANSSRS